MYFQNENIFIFDYDFDRKLLLKEYNKNKNKLEVYGDIYGVSNQWKVARLKKCEYANYLCDLIGINCKPRFYVLEPNKFLGPHVDLNTRCSINILLNYDNPAPVTSENTKYLYKQCVLNTQKIHQVMNTNEERILFKMSIFDSEFSEVCEKVKLKLNIT